MPAGSPSFFVVGIGASAGGLQATTELLSHLPSRAPLALVIVQHLDRQHPSELAELLAHSSRLPVTWVQDQTKLEMGHVYVLPQNREVVVKHGILHLEARRQDSVASTIDVFFRSLAEDVKHFSVGVLLSGTGNDGVVGLTAIKAAGGLTFAQEAKSAAFPGMPKAALEAGCVDRVLAPAEIARQLVTVSEESERVWHELCHDNEHTVADDSKYLVALFRLVSLRRGVNFSHYKQSTILRRLTRRMVLCRVEKLADYVKLLYENREEVDALYESLLINVTEFFRDPEYFEYLSQNIFPSLISRAETESKPLRCWIPACSTGEEAYSIAMLVFEQLGERASACPVQIFATDVSERAIAIARAGSYPPALVEGIAPDRLRRFFTKRDGNYVVTKQLRDTCVFARQNAATDSPFSRLDLISCRNLLIYLGPELQKKLMPLFHYALNPGGYLMLGTSESIGSHVDLFRLVDRRYRIYSKKSTARHSGLSFSVDPILSQLPERKKPLLHMPEESKDAFDIMREADRVVLGRHAPPGILVNEELEILQFRGNVSPYISPAPGRASLNLAKMAPEDFVSELESAVLQAKKENIRVHRANVSLDQAGRSIKIDLDITPIEAVQTKERFYLILFIEPETRSAAAAPSVATIPGEGENPAQLGAQFEQVKQDLQATRNYLQNTIEKHESTYQELRAANEEIQSSNEELQSTNEELETAKEELQSTNEELTTVNEELHNRQGELLQLNNDLHNLINSVHLPIIILDQEMRIRRFTPMAEKVLNVIPTDVGRPLSDLNINLSVADLPRRVREVSETLTQQESEVQDHKGRWYSMRIRPYKSSDSKIEGVVMTLIDIDQLKRSKAEVEEMRNFAYAAAEAVDGPVVGVNARMEIRVANEAFHHLFATSATSTDGRVLFDIASPLTTTPDLRDALVRVLPSGNDLRDLPVTLNLPNRGKLIYKLSTRSIASPSREYPLVLISFKPSEG